MIPPDLGSRSESRFNGSKRVIKSFGRDRLTFPRGIIHHRSSGRSAPVTKFLANRVRLPHGRPISVSMNTRWFATGGRGQRCVTPRQACPRPDGLGRNLRSKTRWFTGFCNSHQVSHFATFFIDARAEISVAESRYRLIITAPTPNTPYRGIRRELFCLMFLGAFNAGVW